MLPDVGQARVGRVLFNPPSRMERRVKENPPYAAEHRDSAGITRSGPIRPRLSHRWRAVGMKRLDRLQPPGLAFLALFLRPDDRLPVGREDEAGAGVGDLDAVAA